MDTFRLQRSKVAPTDVPFGVIHIGGAMGTYKLNPSARMYIMDSTENIPLYVQKMIFDLEYWNNNP